MVKVLLRYPGTLFSWNDHRNTTIVYKRIQTKSTSTSLLVSLVRILTVKTTSDQYVSNNNSANRLKFRKKHDLINMDKRIEDINIIQCLSAISSFYSCFGESTYIL